MFAGYVFVASVDLPSRTRATVRQLGGAVVDELLPSVTHGLVTTAGRAESLACAHHLRGLRLPIVREDWVRASAAAGRALPTRHPLAAHDPNLFAALRFTTTRVPAAIRENVIAAVLFFGGAYAAEMTAGTSVVLHGLRKEGAVESPKARAAAARGVPCVSIAWVQDCVSAGRRLPLPGDGAGEEETREKEEAEGEIAAREKGAANSRAVPSLSPVSSAAEAAAPGRKRGRLDSIVERIVAGRAEFAARRRPQRLISQIEEACGWDDEDV